MSGLLAVGPDVHVELCDLVGVLTRSGHFDGAGPVEVEVAEREGQLLNLNPFEFRVVLGHEEVGRQNAALGSTGRGHEEVELLVAVTVLHQTLVNDAPRRRVLKFLLTVGHEEALADPLVDHYHSDLGFQSRLVVQDIEGSFKLRDLGA